MSREDLNVTSFDHDALKQSLVSFLSATGKFDDFDFEGSALNTLIDLLTRNTHFDSFLANMIAGESFLKSAQIRGNVVSHASKLSYTPRSCVSSKAMINVKVVPAEKINLPYSITMPSKTVFLAVSNGQSYQFITKDDYILNLDSNNDYVIDDVIIYQGQLISNSFVHVANTTLEIPNQRVDTSSLSVYSIESGDKFVFDLAESITELTLDKNFFFLSENFRKHFVIEFGKDLISREPITNSTINIEYISVPEEHANGANLFISGSTINGYANIQITTTQSAYGGYDEEDIEDIRFLAPNNYQAQDRALAPNDYKVLVKKQFPFIRDINFWGGEDNDPPQYGYVFMSMITQDGEILTRSIKQEIVTYLKDRNVGSITPVITDSERIGIDLVVNFGLDDKKTNKTFNQLSTEIKSLIESYNTSNLSGFGSYYNDSELTNRIMDIRGVETLDIFKTCNVQLPVLRFENPTYSYNFKNELETSSLYVDSIQTDINSLSEYITDDGLGNVIHYKNTNLGPESKIIGTIDYDSGYLEFSINMIQSDLYFNLEVTPEYENFYVYNNKYVYIDKIEFEKLTISPKM